MTIDIFHRLLSDQDSLSFHFSIPSRFIRYIKNNHALPQILSVVKHFFLQEMSQGVQKVMIQQLFAHTFQFRGSLRLFQFLSELRTLYLARSPSNCSLMYPETLKGFHSFNWTAEIQDWIKEHAVCKKAENSAQGRRIFWS